MKAKSLPSSRMTRSSSAKMAFSRSFSVKPQVQKIQQVGVFQKQGGAGFVSLLQLGQRQANHLLCWSCLTMRNT